MASIGTQALALADVLRPHLVRAERILDLSQGHAELFDPSILPDGIEYERPEADVLEEGAIGTGTLLIATIGRDGSDHAESFDAFAAIRRLAAGGRFAIAVGGPLDREIGRDLVDRLALLECHVLEIDPVSGSELQAVILGVRDDHRPTARDNDAATLIEERQLDLRVANRLVLGWYLQQLVPSDDSSASNDFDALSGTDVRRMSQRLSETESRLAAIETSTSYRVGRTIVQAVRRPSNVARLIPRLADVRPRRSSKPRVRPTSTLPSRVDSRAAWNASIRYGPERLFQAYSSGAEGARTRLVIAGVLRDETAEILGHDTTVHRLTPNDAALALERADPDFLLIETGAFGAGRQWAYAGNPAAIDRDRELLRLIASCRRLGRPAVLWRTAATPFPIGIGELASQFDVVLDATGRGSSAEWLPGVQLARFNLLGANATRSSAPTLVGTWDERAPRKVRKAHQELLEGLLADGLEVRVDQHSVVGVDAFPESLRPAFRGTVDPTRAGAIYRSQALIVDDPFARSGGADRALDALACGARILGTTRLHLLGLPADAVIAVDEAGSVATAISGAIAAGTLPPARARAVSRVLFQHHAVPVALARLVDHLGLAIDPLAGRGVSLIVRMSGGTALDGIATAIVGQTHRPREVVAVMDGDQASMTSALDEISAAGITVRVGDRSADLDDAPDHPWVWAAADAHEPWIRGWTSSDHGPDDLLDLVLAAEASRADAVGYTDGPSLAFVGDLPLDASLIRRDVLAPENTPPGALAAGRLEPWARRGARICGVGNGASR